MSDISAAASRLCAGCGMCCNGVMFDFVRLQAPESPKSFAALGLKVKRRHGEIHCVQPCPAHVDSQCGIYASRPSRCQEFECRQLQRVASGKITEAEALVKIREATQMVADVSALLGQFYGDNPRRALTQRCVTALTEPHDPSSAEARRLLASAKGALDVLLEESFRVAVHP